MRGVALPAVALVTALLAGCAASSGADNTSDIPGVDVQATPTTGIIKGVVVDLAIKPLPKALVTVKLGGTTLTNVTNANGGFGFEGLEPGTYFLTASLAGYKASQTSVEVVANQDDVPTTRISLEADATFVKPYVTLQKHVGFIECTTSFVVLCGAPNLLTGMEITPDRFTWDQYFADGADLIQSEMAWQSTQTLSPELFFQNELLNGGCDAEDVLLNETSGPSPIMTRAWGDRIAKDKIGSVCPIYYSVFSGGIPGTPCTDVPPEPVGHTCAGFTFEQKFEVYMLDFHGFLPPMDYLFVRDGPLKPPE